MKAIVTGAVVVMVCWLAGAGGSPNDDRVENAKSVSAYITGVIGSKHDLTDPATGFRNACAACHVPHIQALRPTSQPTTRPTVQRFRIPGQRRVFTPGRFTPGPTSLVCLGCHDGTVATSTIGSSHALLAGVREGFAVPDGFVWRDHPIGVPYPLARGAYRPRSFVLAEGKLRLPEGRLECVTCHDPHNASGAAKMLVMSNRRSALCLRCHVK